MTTPEVLPGLFACSNGSRRLHGLTEALVLDQLRSLNGLDTHQSKEPSLTEAGVSFHTTGVRLHGYPACLSAA